MRKSGPRLPELRIFLVLLARPNPRQVSSSTRRGYRPAGAFVTLPLPKKHKKNRRTKKSGGKTGIKKLHGRQMSMTVSIVL